MRVLVIPDKFKGTLTAGAAAAALARGWQRARRHDRLELVPLGDGGDGFGEVLSQALGARAIPLRTVDAAHRPCTARWWLAPRTKTAVVDSASVIGLAMLPPKKFHPFELDTFGLGAVLRAAARRHPSRCIVGIGGSATNDGGFGVARALGWKFEDHAGNALEQWTEMWRLAAIRPPRRRRWFKDLVVAVDVGNPLLGQRGATRIYGPQKGLGSRDFPRAERNLRRLAHVVELGGDLARTPGAGAAGGLGFGLMAFAGARLAPGFDLFARQVGLERRLRRADLVLTGEGALDNSTLMGKGVGRVAQRCRELAIPCIGLSGELTLSRANRSIFTGAYALTQLTDSAQACARAGFWLEKLAERVGRAWKAG
jgi:glycerate kinase